MTFTEEILVILFIAGSLTQFFLLCPSVQTSLDAILLDAVKFIILHYINYFYFVSNINDINITIIFKFYVHYFNHMTLRSYI